ncbi:hypothetical protein L596_005807 [Steinernema carpocapsae]|uniref:Uncharacterized protein n=1 Tax=Steinernema carpocapsae TaxID=34508 RepID=A0A4U8V0G0_STECR|nr:hypothetical protein L596_005807 [Steinernema carpocapsae]
MMQLTKSLQRKHHPNQIIYLEKLRDEIFQTHVTSGRSRNGLMLLQTNQQIAQNSQSILPGYHVANTRAHEKMMILLCDAFQEAVDDCGREA